MRHRTIAAAATAGRDAGGTVLVARKTHDATAWMCCCDRNRAEEGGVEREGLEPLFRSEETPKKKHGGENDSNDTYGR